MITSFDQALEYLYTYIPRGALLLFPGFKGLERTQYLLQLLDNPQDKINVIHIAGTSGKGSTAYLTSLLLTSLGFKVGLHFSPHIIDIRERIQINNQLISKEKFVTYLNEIIPAIERMKDKEWGTPTYFEVLTALHLYVAWKEKVDYDVMETGLGGLYDATNAVQNERKLVILTKIGKDHTRVLGNTLAKIAAQKAGIIHPYNIVLSAWQAKSVREVFDQTAKENRTHGTYIENGITFRNLDIDKNGITFDFSYDKSRPFVISAKRNFSGSLTFVRDDNKENDNKVMLKQLHLGMVGKYQAENASLALSAVYTLSQRDTFDVNEQKVRQALSSAHLLGRMEIRHVNSKTVIIDGAHNPQKMQAFLTSLQLLFPKKKFHFLIAFKKNKDVQSMLKQIIPFAKDITITTFFDSTNDWLQYHASHEPKALGTILDNYNFHNYHVIKSSKKALEACIAVDDINPIVITGSLYLLGELYSTGQLLS